MPRIHSMSAPAQNVSPALWSTTAREERSTRRTVAVSSAISVASNAFFRSGREMVMRETPRDSELSVTVSLIARTLDGVPTPQWNDSSPARMGTASQFSRGGSGQRHASLYAQYGL